MSLRLKALCTIALAFSLAGCPETPTPVDAPVTPDGGDGGARDAGRDGGGVIVDGGGDAGGGPVCGNSVVDGTEACDDGNTTANDGCSATCTEETGWSCDGADPTVCTEVCGDGTLVGDEAGANGCDDGGTAADDGCSATCTVEMGWACAGAPSVCTADCGDGAINGVEVCDDGDNVDNDGCSMSCQVETGWTCDTAEPTVCTSTCGDGDVAVGAETCDDGNTVDADGCSATCATESGYDCSTGTCLTICGDMMIVGAEQCDDGNAVSEACAYGAASCVICASDCTNQPGLTSVCGDGNFDTVNEMCDDGNTVTETACAYGTATCTQCEADCTAEVDLTGNVCGDMMVDATNETCDDGNTTALDGCDATCQTESVCGDGTVEGLETCDDANTAAGDGCSDTCATEAGYVCAGAPSLCSTVCGDGTQAGTESCDDGNTVGADGCSSCRLDRTETEPNEDGTPSTGGSAIAGNDFDNAGGVAVMNANANGAILASERYRLTTAALATAGDEDVFAIRNDTTGPVTVRGDIWNTDAAFGVGVSCGSTATSIDTGINVRNAAGVVLASNDDRVSTVDYCSGLNFPLAAGETVYLHVVAFGDNEVIPGYALEVSFRPVVCGDGSPDSPETCDDGNTAAGDGCSVACAVEAGFSCAGSPSVCTPAPTNTTCALATAVTGTTSFPALDVAFGGARPTGSGCTGGTGSRAFYWTVTVPAGQIANITTTGTIDRVLSIQTDCATTACSFSTDSFPEAGTINNLAGTSAITRIVSVYSYSSSSTGTLGVNFTFVTPPPPPVVSTITASCVTSGTWTSLTRSGTSDDATTAIAALPFTFRYFGTDVTHFSTSTNGFAQLWTSSTGTPSSAFSNVTMPTAATPNGVVAGFWDDMYLGAAFDIRTQTTGSAGSRIFIIEWQDALAGSGGLPVTFQLQFSEAADVIEAHYCSVGASARASGNSATVGVEDLTGTSGINASFNTAGGVVAGSGYRFTF